MRNVLIFFLLFIGTVQAQDTIFRQDGTHSVVTILEINPAVVKYQLYDNTQGLVFFIDKNYVKKIVYRNGDINFFPGITLADDTIHARLYPKHDIVNSGNNIISLNAGGLFWGVVTLNYEHILKSGNFSLKIPLSAGLSAFNSSNQDYTYEEYSPRQTIIGSGINFNFYPGGQRKVAYFLGPAIDIRAFNTFQYNYDPATSNYIVNKKVGFIYGLLFQNGISFQAGTNLYLSLNLGLGFGYFDIFNSYVTFMSRGGANIGYQF